MVVRNTQNDRGRRRVGGPPVAAIYTRVSDTNEEENVNSHEFQEGPCRTLAAALGYDEVEVYSDNFSGRFLHERPALSRLRESVRSGRVGVVIVWKLDRFSRRTAQRAVVVQELRQHGVEYVSATEEISDTPEGRLLEALLSAIAEFEVERTLERSSATLAILKERGDPICAGKARYGYRYDKTLRVRVIVEDEATVVRLIFDRYLLGDSSIAIAAHLNNLEIPCPAVARKVKLKGGRAPRWNPSTIRAFLRDESYAGAPMTSGKKRSTGDVDASGNSRTEKTDPSAWWRSRESTPPILAREVFDRVQSLIQAGPGSRETRNGSVPYLLRGMVKCAVCGRTMSPEPHRNPKGRSYSYFVCTSVKDGDRCGSKGTPVVWLDREVWDAVVARVTDRGVVEEMFAEIAREHRVEDLDRDRAAHDRELENSRAAIRRLMTRLEATDDPEILAPLEGRLVELRSIVAAHRAEIDLIDGKLVLVRNRRESLERWWHACERGRADLIAGEMSFEQKRLFLQALDVRVVAQHRQARVKFGILLAGGGVGPEGELVVTDNSHGGVGEDDQQRLTFQFALTG